MNCNARYNLSVVSYLIQETVTGFKKKPKKTTKQKKKKQKKKLCLDLNLTKVLKISDPCSASFDSTFSFHNLVFLNC